MQISNKHAFTNRVLWCDILKITQKLINDNLVDYIASDIHNLNHIKIIEGNNKGKKIYIKTKKTSKIERIFENTINTFD